MIYDPLHRHGCPSRCGEPLDGVGDVDTDMLDRFSLARLRLGSADIEAAVDLA
jgi:hypothetical protein